MKRVIITLFIAIFIICTVLFVGCSSNQNHQHQYLLKDYQVRSCTQDEILTYICFECGDIKQETGQSKLSHFYNELDRCIFCNGDKPFELWLEECDIASKIQVGPQEFNFLSHTREENVIPIVMIYFKSFKKANNLYDFVIYEPTINSDNYDIIIDNWPVKFVKYIFEDLSPNGFFIN